MIEPDADRTESSDGAATLNVEQLVHDINNVTGRLMSTLYLCLSDIEHDHPVRDRLEAANAATIDLRSLTQRLEAKLRAERR